MKDLFPKFFVRTIKQLSLNEDFLKTLSEKESLTIGPFLDGKSVSMIAHEADVSDTAVNQRIYQIGMKANEFIDGLIKAKDIRYDPSVATAVEQELAISFVEEELLPDIKSFFYPIADLALSVRTLNALRAEGIFRIGDLVPHREKKLLSFSNIGDKALKSIQEELVKLNCFIRR